MSAGGNGEDGSRARILAKVRAGLAQGADVERRRVLVDQRLAERPRHLIPARTAGKTGADLIAELKRWLEAAAGEVIEVDAEADVPVGVAGYLRRHNLAQRVRIGGDAMIAGLPWTVEPTLTVVQGRAAPEDGASVTHAFAAVAESGTVLVASGADNPVTLSFLPATNIVVVRRGDVVGPLEDAWVKARAYVEAHGQPRTLNLISGPSRSADIGGVPVLGAHGPQRLCLIVVG